MKQNLIFLFFLLLLTTCLSAQRDFNYELFTTKMTDTIDSNHLTLNIYRIVKKKDNQIMFVNPINTGNSIAYYEIDFIGYQEDGCFLYLHKLVSESISNARIMFKIYPLEPRIIVQFQNDKGIEYKQITFY